MTEAQHLPPVPDAERFRLPSRFQAPARVVWTTVPTEWAELDELELIALPPNSRRTLEAAPGLYVTLIKGANGTWTLMNRQGISSRALAGARTAPRVPIDPAQCPGQ